MATRLNIVTIHGNRQLSYAEAERVRLLASIGVQVSREIEEEEMERYKPIDAPDRPSVRRAMEAVEARLVESLWTLARLPDRNPFGSGRCGLDYIQEHSDRFSNAVANGGKWDEIPPRPPTPSARAIDAMHEPLEWLAWLHPERAKLVSVVASTKRGDAGRNVSWARVRAAYPPAQTQTIRTLQRSYDGGLRAIVSRLTLNAFTKAA